MFAPMQGLRIVDLTQVLAGPYCGYLLALMGAEVIKIEKPGEGDWTRRGGGDPRLSEAAMGVSYLTQNANKKSLTLDLKKPEAIEIVKKLVVDADVFIENYRPGVAARLGLGPDDLQAENERLVYCSISAYGQTGPLSGRAAYDHILQAACGIMGLTGSAETVPNKVGAPYIDYATGLNAAFAISSALHEVRRTGQGQHIDVAMLDTAMMLMASHFTNYNNTGIAPQPAGLNAFSGSPSSGSYETTTGLLLIAANNERQFIAMCHVLDRSDLLTDERFADPLIRRENAPALMAILTEIFARQSAEHWENLLNDGGVPASELRDFAAAATQPQILARELSAPVPLPGLDFTAQLPSLSFWANGAAVAPTAPPPALGADSDAILRDLGYDADEIAALHKQDVI